MILYGQTSSGKTYTLFGNKTFKNATSSSNEVEKYFSGIQESTNNTIEAVNGIVPRYIINLFNELNKYNEDPDFSFSFEYSFFEIYNEKIYDLLNQTYDLVDMGNEKVKKVLKNLNLREKKENKVVIGNILI